MDEQFIGSPPESVEPTHKSDSEVTSTHQVEFSVDDTNHDYAKGVYLRNARELQARFVELYKEDPSAQFRLTLERL